MAFPRFDAPEALDLNLGSLDEAGRSLDDLRRINRWLGGTRVLHRHLRPRLQAATREADRPLVVADIGAGSADIPISLVTWARREGIPLRVLAVDLNQRHLALALPALAAYPEIQLLGAYGGNLPLVSGVDYIVASLFVHHFAPPDVVDLLRSWYQVAHRGVIINDLVRDPLHYVGYFALQPFIARSPLTRYDAPLSIRRAYTLAEMADLAAQAAVPARLYWHWPWRMALVADKS